MSPLRRLVLLAGLCALAVSIVAMTASPARSSTSAYVRWCHSDPDTLEFCEWREFMTEPENREWFEWATTVKPARAWTVWDRLAQCESHGQWDYNPHTATWGTRIFEGGLQFHPTTWDGFRLPGYPHAAYLATRAQQIAVGERVLAAQGWGAWPACSRKLGLR